jgi:hypothetical protein
MRGRLPSILVALTFCATACGEARDGERRTSQASVATPPPGTIAQCDRLPVATDDAQTEEEEPGCEQTQLEGMLQDHCGPCHSEQHFMVPIDYIPCPMVPVTFAELIEIGKVTPGNAEGSRLIVRLRDNSMPPPSSQLPPLSEQQIARLADFIDTLESGTSPTCEPVSGPASE